MIDYHIIMNAVESSNIESIGYSEFHKVLCVIFKNRSKYFYYEIPEELYKKLMADQSKGKFIAANIKGKFDFHRVDENNNKIVEKDVAS